MKIIDLTQVEVRKRQRSSIPSTHVNELKESILASGLIHPPVFWFDLTTATWVLTVGECRLRAIRLLAGEKKTFRCGDVEIEPGKIAVTPLADYLNEIDRFGIELDENVRRLDLEWPDRMRAYSDLHLMRTRENPKQTKEATGVELIAKGMVGSSGAPINDAKAAEKVVSQAIIIAQHLDNEKIANARNPAEALQLIYKQEEEKALAALIRRRQAAAPSKPDIEIRHGDLTEVLPLLDSSTFDLVVADPPYGISAGGAGFRARSVHHHNYEDTLDIAKLLAQTILTEGFRLVKPRGNIYIFCDIDLFDWLKSTAANMGWVPFRRPLIWQKSESEGLAPWGAQGPRITTEFIFYATKGQRGMTASPIDVFNVKRVPRKERIHAAEKPVELLSQLIRCTTIPGDRVLDPCCGSGSSLVACRELGRTGLGVEKDSDYFNTALANVHGGTASSTESQVDISAAASSLAEPQSSEPPRS